MAQTPQSITIQLDVADARRAIKRVLALAGEANRVLARLEDRVGALRDELAELGIKLEVKE